MQGLDTVLVELLTAVWASSLRLVRLVKCHTSRVQPFSIEKRSTDCPMMVSIDCLMRLSNPTQLG